MAKITVAGNAVVVTSSMKLEDLEMIQKYRPEALTLKGGEDGKEPIFAITTADCGCGEITKYGATFAGETHDEEKLAVITLAFVDRVADIKEWIADKIGSAIMNLNKLEESLPAVAEALRSERKAVMDNITVL